MKLLVEKELDFELIGELIDTIVEDEPLFFNLLFILHKKIELRSDIKEKYYRIMMLLDPELLESNNETKK